MAGSGKSTLIHSVFLKEYPDAIVIDQSAAHANIRSNPATYTGIMDPIRKAFEKKMMSVHHSLVTIPKAPAKTVKDLVSQLWI